MGLMMRLNSLNYLHVKLMLNRRILQEMLWNPVVRYLKIKELWQVINQEFIKLKGMIWLQHKNV